MPSSFYPVALPFLRVIYPPSRCTETVYLSKAPYIRHIAFFCSWEGMCERGAIFGRITSLVGPFHSMFQWKTENNRNVTFWGPLVLELSTSNHWFTLTYDFHHTLFCHPTLFTLFSCLSLPRRFFAAYMHTKQDNRKNLILCSWLSNAVQWRHYPKNG